MAAQLTGYELMVIFKPLLPDDVRKGSHKALITLAKNHKGEVTNADVWGKRYLAYPIVGHDEGYYIVYELELPQSELAEFSMELKQIPEVLRFLITRIEHPEVARSRLNKKVIDI
jgi:small subunit ribosomal protein S6